MFNHNSHCPRYWFRKMNDKIHLYNFKIKDITKQQHKTFVYRPSPKLTSSLFLVII